MLFLRKKTIHLHIYIQFTKNVSKPNFLDADKNMDEEIRKHFSEKFNEGIKLHFGYIPKNSEIATLISINIHPITSETARRWRLGINVPELIMIKKIGKLLNVRFDDLFD